MPGAIDQDLLIGVEANLDEDKSLHALAVRSGYSPFHFHRLFTEAVGETPKRHVDRLRLERAAYLVAVTDQPLLELALDLGFSGAETFSRAFRRAWGRSPSQYRAAAKRAHVERLRRLEGFRGDGCLLSEVWFGILPPMDFICVRRMGSYYDLLPEPFTEGDVLWRRVADFAEARGMAHQREAWCIPYDNPQVTDDLKQRMDACIVAGPGSVAGEIRRLDFEGGPYAGAEHIGPHETVPQVYTHVADGIRRSSAYVFGGGPPVQVFRHLDKDPNRHRTEVYFPVVRA